jgi:hypothetical protein
MDIFPLPIFPERSLAESVITTVWIGIAIICFFNLRLGWPLSGLVVPGYIVPLMIAKPSVAIVVCVEGFVSYFIVRYVCDRFVFSGSWSSFFGRDRFFALVISSLLVRLVFDGWFLPLLGEFMNRQLDIAYDFRNNLSSFGLIIVALVANQFWKTGFVRGLVPFWTTMLITYVIVRFVLMEFTNFNIGNLEYMYENISASLVASPKAYIVLLTCAYIASRMNLLYGWDFNGILIPSLLALEWYHPAKIGTTLLEAVVIYTIGSMLIKSPIFSRLTMENARKVLLFFNVSYFYKFILGHVQQGWFAEASLTDLYGYGYLVPTLIAVKIHDKNIPFRLTRATLQTSLVGAIVAGIIGFLLTHLPQPSFRDLPKASAIGLADSPPTNETLAETLRRDKLRLYESRRATEFRQPMATELDVFVRALRSIDRYVRTSDDESLRMARTELSTIGYDAKLLENRFLYIHETRATKGWGIFVIDVLQRKGLLVEVPAPLDEWAVFESGLFVFRDLGARGLAISGTSRRRGRDRSADVLRNGQTLFHVFHHFIGRDGALQVRGYNDRTLLELTDVEDEVESHVSIDSVEARSALWVSRSLPIHMDLVALRRSIGSYAVEWRKTPHSNLQRDDSWAPFCELVLNREDRKKLLSLLVVKEIRSSQAGSRLERYAGSARTWVLDRQAAIAPAGSEAYRVPRVEELLFFDEEILGPMLDVITSARSGLIGEEDLAHGLEVVAPLAGVFGYRLTLIDDTDSSSRFVAVHEPEEPAERRHWGTLIIRIDRTSPYTIQVPRPGLEIGTFEYGAELFFRLGAEYGILAGAHPKANRNGSADPTKTAHRVSLFQLFHHATVRQDPDRAALIVQVRAFGSSVALSSTKDDLFLGFADGCTSRGCFSELGSLLHDTLRDDGVLIRLVDGDRLTAGYEAYGSLQAHYPSLHPRKEFAILWISPFFASTFVQHSNEGSLAERFSEAGLAVSIRDLHQTIVGSSARLASSGPAVLSSVPESLAYVAETGDVVALRTLADEHPDIQIELVIDSGTRRPFTVLRLPDGSFAAAVNMSPFAVEETTLLSREAVSRELIDTFKRSRHRRLEIESEP